MAVIGDMEKLTIGSNTYTIADAQARSDLDGKQDTLVSGTNIKTINNHSLLGSGNISIVNEAEEFTGVRSNAIYRGE